MTTPIDVSTGLAVLVEHGYTAGLTKMVIEHALQLHARGEPVKAEKKATDAGFHGVDITTWNVVLNSALEAGRQKDAAQAVSSPAPQALQMPSEQSPFDDAPIDETDQQLSSEIDNEQTHGNALSQVDDVSSIEQAPGHTEPSIADIFESARSDAGHAPSDAPEVQSPAIELGDLSRTWEDVVPIEVPAPGKHRMPQSSGIVVDRAISPADVVMILLEHHRSDEKHDCGAQTESLPCEWSNGCSSHVRHCTQAAGHRGDHKDGLHCWANETFRDDQVVRYSPRNLGSCIGCKQLGVEHAWPCPFAKEVVEVARHLGLDLPD